MALSNWDTLAVDENGKATNGVFVTPLGVRAEFYKNWLYVGDAKAWREGAFTENTVMQIENGVIRYLDLRVHAVRGPQEGVYAALWHGYDCKEVMVGCGVYGFEGGEWVGVKEESLQFLKEFLNRSDPVWDEEELARNEKAYREYAALHGGKMAGGKDLEEALADMRASRAFDLEEKIRNIDLSGALRFNQGDAYFAQNFQTEVPATPTGQAMAPWIMKMCADGKDTSPQEDKQ